MGLRHPRAAGQARLVLLSLVAACSSRGDRAAPGAPPRATPPAPEPPALLAATPSPTAEDEPAPSLRCEAATRPRPFQLDGNAGWACTDEEGHKDGPFVTAYPDGAVAVSGRYRADLLEGPWQRFHPNGKTAELGAYAAGKRDGLWQRFAKTGGLLGDFRMRRGSGVERQWYDDGQLASEREYADGTLHGPSTLYGDGGVVLAEASYTFDRLDGHRRFGTSKSMRVEDRWKQGSPRGTRKLWRRNVLTLEMSFDDEGNLHGPFTAWRDRVTPRERGAYVRGDRHGVWRWFGRGGELEREGSYFLGLRHGAWRQWDGGRLIMQGRYVKGRPHGTFQYWSKSGGAIGKCKLKNGTGELLTFHDNGLIATRTTLVRGMRHGVYQELSMRGRVLVNGTYASDLQHGLWTERDLEGRLVREATYVEGKLDGVQRRYLRGKLSSETSYVAGVREGRYRELGADPAGEEVELVSGAFTADRKSGEWVFRGADGQPRLTAHFLDGVLDGEWRQAGVDGELRGRHRDGRRTGTWTWTERGSPAASVQYGQP